ncbi:sporulation protein YpjB [Paenibacillus sp. N3.4]|uniref:sporulation protein YpjB n=1 Tax=Paenibacillus sp. N3.4 TaxID=2603222 RepID=UPI00164F4D15|nr:sporulation protein YpjB [Paenibacillus sp. N3.4]
MFHVTLVKRFTTALMLTLMITISAACAGASRTSIQTVPVANAAEIQKIQFLNQIADEMYKNTMDGQVIEARSKLMQLSDQIPKIHFEGITSVEGLNALTETITQAKRVYNAVKYSPEDGQIAVAKIRLATDALTHKNQPMWLQYYKVLQDDRIGLSEAIRVNKKQEAITNFGKLSQHIAVIRPSILISRDAGSVEQLDSILVHIRSNLDTSPLPLRQLESGLDHFDRIINELFMRNKDAMAFVPITDPRQPIIWSLGIGLIIVSVLSFAGWRMYQSGRHIVSMKQTKESENR